MKTSQKVYNIMSILFGIILIGWLTEIDYGNLSFGNNRSAYLGITSAILFIFAMQLAKKKQK